MGVPMSEEVEVLELGPVPGLWLWWEMWKPILGSWTALEAWHGQCVSRAPRPWGALIHIGWQPSIPSLGSTPGVCHSWPYSGPSHTLEARCVSSTGLCLEAAPSTPWVTSSTSENYPSAPSPGLAKWVCVSSCGLQLPWALPQ